MASVRDLIVRNVSAMFPSIGFATNLQILAEELQPGAWAKVPMNASLAQAVNVIVDLALTQGWGKKLVAKIPRNPSNTAELDMIGVLLASQEPTVSDPYLEVLLKGN